MVTPSIGIALGAGGSRGLAHVGVLKVLRRHHVSINSIAGTSVGALIGALYAAWADVEKVECFLLEHCGVRSWFSFLDPSLKGGLLAGRKIEIFLDRSLGKLHFDQLKIPLCVVATDLTNGTEMDIQSGRVAKAVRASFAAAPLFTPVRFEGRLAGDGSLVNPIPDDVVRRMGAERVIAVNLDTGFQAHPLTRLSLTDIAYRSLSIMRNHFSRRTTRTADIVIEPKIESEFVVGLPDFFNRRKVQANIAAGEAETVRRLPEIKRLLRLSRS